MKRILAIGAFLYAAAFAVLVLGQNSIIYPFDPEYEKPEPRITEHRLTTPDNNTLIVWAAKAKHNKPTLVYFHGNAGNLATRAQRFDRLLDRGYGFVAMGYRGSSGSTGTPSEKHIRNDSLLLYSKLETYVGKTRKLVFYGESLGTTVAIHLAAKHAPKGLILEAPFTSIKARARESLPMFPTGLGLRDTWNSLDQMPGITSPLLVLHGTADTTVPFAHGKRIFEAAGASKKQFYAVEGLGHTGHWSVAGQKTIYKFLDAL